MSFTSEPELREPERESERESERGGLAREPAPRWGDVYLVAAARGISYCGDYLAATVLALALQSAGDGGLGVAALMLAEIGPLVVLGSLAGRLADRVDSRTLLVTVGLAQAGICTLLAYSQSKVLIILLVALLAAGVAVTQPTLSALLTEVAGRERLGRANAVAQTGASLGMLLGPALGGILVGVAGSRLPLLIDAGSFLAVVAAGLLLQTRRGRSVSEAPEESVADWRLRRDGLLRTLVIAVPAVIAAVSAVSVVEVFFVRETLGSTTTVYGLIGAVFTGGMLIGAVPFGRLRGSDERLVRIMLVALAALCGLIAISAGVPAAGWLIPIYLAGGVMNSSLNVLAGVVVGRRVPAAVRGKAFGTLGAVASAANMTGFLAGGLLLQVLTPRPIVLGAGLAGMVVASIFLVSHFGRQEEALGYRDELSSATPPRSAPASGTSSS